MDITPMIPKGRQVIDAYGDGRFKIAGRHWDGPVIVTAEATHSWSATTMDEVTADSLAALADSNIDILLIGCGLRMQPLPKALQEALRTRNISADPMDTGAACRTYNVLMAEGRRVAAALFPV